MLGAVKVTGDTIGFGGTGVTRVLPFGSTSRSTFSGSFGSRWLLKLEVPFQNMNRYPESQWAQPLRWINTCQGHPECTIRKCRYVPTRLINIGKKTGLATLRLVDMKKI
jgi:hypothetical protein